MLAPHSAYGSSDEWNHPVRWALIHGGFILAASITQGYLYSKPLSTDAFADFARDVDPAEGVGLISEVS